jgi:hypothetical protein
MDPQKNIQLNGSSERDPKGLKRKRTFKNIVLREATAGEAAAFRASHSEWASISTYLTMLPPESGREAGSGGGEGG